MIATCPACRWPTPSVLSSHGTLAYLRCVCGLFLVADRGVIIATPGTSAFGPIHHGCGDQDRLPVREPS